MIVQLSDVPRRERHLLFCSQLLPHRRRKPRFRSRRRSAYRPDQTTNPGTIPPLDAIPSATSFGAAGSHVA